VKLKHAITLSSIMLLFWIGLIFYFSSQPSDQSNQQSFEVVTVYERLNAVFDFSDSPFFNKIEAFVFEDLLEDTYKSTNSKVRKSAHFGIYFVLGIFSALFGWLYAKKWLIAALMGICLPITIAVLDEFNQGIIGRTSRLNDVILDGSGALMGVCVFLISLAALSGLRKQTLRKKVPHK